MSAETIARKWHDRLLSIEPVDHAQAEAAVRAVYRSAGLDEPDHFVWCASPIEAAWAAQLLIGKSDGYNHATLEDVQRSKAGKARLPEVRAELAARLGLEETEVEGRFGKPFYRAEGSSPVARQLQKDSVEALMARCEAGDDFLAVHRQGPFQALHQLEQDLFFEGISARLGRGSLYSEAIAAAGPKPLAVLALRSAHNRLYGSFAFTEVALDETLADAGILQPTELQRAMWAAYEACGLWWPCEQGVILCERPAAAELASEGPRMQWSDGFTVGGKPVPAEKAPTAPAAAPEPVRQSAAGEPTPFLDRYLAGEHAQVWSELVALGESVRIGAHAVDALAVARETMRRVEQNVRTLANRLDELGYRFVDPAARGGLFGLGKPKAHPPHVPPAGDADAQVAVLERAAGGAVPLSLRAFYEVVGEVNFLGEHPILAPRGSADSDPLFVHGVADAIACVESWDDDEDGRMIVIAPDAFHKANISGGDPYLIAVPNAAADAPLEEEPHGVTFVEYLRIAILGSGGFPGWQGRASRPAELDALREGLIPF